MHYPIKNFHKQFVSCGKQIVEHYEQREYSRAIREIMQLADQVNQYIDAEKPWLLIKNDSDKEKVQGICTLGLNLFRIIILYLKPVLPELAKQVESFFKIPELTWDDINQPLLDHEVAEFKPLLQRIDIKKVNAMFEKSQTESNENTATVTNKESSHISYDDFAKVDLRVAKIIEAEHVDGADKLLKLKVDVGGETRQIFAGIKSAFQPEELIGKLTVVVANLAPRKMRFGVSEGMMILASDPDSNELILIEPQQGAKPGMKVK